MNNEAHIKQALISKFNYLTGKIRIQRQRRIFLDIAVDNFNEVFDYIIKQLSFCHLCAITGLDEGDSLGIIYHLSQASGIILSVKISVPKTNPIIKTITPYFPCAEIYERELMDLLGVKVDVLAPSHRYPLPDDWPVDEFPLRKDWKPDISKYKKEKKSA